MSVTQRSGAVSVWWNEQSRTTIKSVYVCECVCVCVCVCLFVLADVGSGWKFLGFWPSAPLTWSANQLSPTVHFSANHQRSLSYASAHPVPTRILHSFFFSSSWLIPVLSVKPISHWQKRQFFFLFCSVLFYSNIFHYFRFCSIQILLFFYLCCIPFYSVLFYSVLFNCNQFKYILLHLVVFYSNLFHSILLCFILFCSVQLQYIL